MCTRARELLRGGREGKRVGRRERGYIESERKREGETVSDKKERPKRRQTRIK
jgi:hypothetical protein